jgi:broad specificity polyphosphatase/5'/3'-nucleotidase SurE
VENKINEARLKEHLKSWIKVLPTKEHLDLFIKNNEKMSDEDKVTYTKLWEEAMGQESVEEAVDNPVSQEYWELEKAIEEEVVEEDTFVLGEEFRVTSKKNKKNK